VGRGVAINSQGKRDKQRREEEEKIEFIKIKLKEEENKMKKLIIILVITVCLLIFMGGIYCMAKEASSPCQMWNSMDDNNKISYIMGVIDGIEICMYKLTDWLPAFITNKEGKVLFFAILEDHEHFVGLFYDEAIVDDYNKFIDRLHTVAKTISDLYKDPANTYINVSAMCLLASRKLRGESIESLLRELRKEAL